MPAVSRRVAKTETNAWRWRRRSDRVGSRPLDTVALVLGRIPDAIVAFDNDWRCTFVNARAGDTIGQRPADLLGRSLWADMPETASATFGVGVREAMASQEPAFIEQYFPPLARWLENRIYPSTDGVIVFIHDIGARKAAERAHDARRAQLALREAQLELTFAAVRQGLYDANVETGEVHVNDSYAAMLGFTPEDFGQEYAEWVTRIHPDDRGHAQAVYANFLAGVLPEYRVEFRIRTASGRWLWVLSTGAITERTPEGKPRRVLGTHTDIDALKESQLELQRFKATLDQILEGVFMFSLEPLAFLYMNEGGRRQLGVVDQELASVTPLVLGLGDDDDEVVRTLLPLVLGTAPRLTLRTAMRHRDGRRVPVETELQFVVTAGLAPRFVATVREISARLAVEEALRASEENLAITLQSIGDAVIATDARGCVTRMNPTAEALTGWSLREARGKHLRDVFVVINAHTRLPALAPVEQVLVDGKKVGLANHTVLLSRDGREYQISDSAAPIRDLHDDVVGVVLVFSDVTAQYQAQEALREREERLQTIIETEPECVKVVARNGTLVEMNAAGLAMLEVEPGRPKHEIDLARFIVPEYRPAFAALHRRVIAGERGTLEFEIIGARGTRRWLETHAAPLANKPGETPLLLGISRDITVRKQAEVAREQLESQLMQAQKMEAIGQLAGGVAHDFNNLLSVINSTAELAWDGLPEGDPVREDLLQIRQAGERAAALTTQLLAFSRSQLMKLEVLDVSAVLTHISQMLARVVREDVALEFVTSGEPVCVRADRLQLERVFVNLAVNARDAMPAGGRLTITTRGERFGEPLVTNPALPAGDYVVLSISDTGVGIEPSVIGRIFDPFFTTKGTGRGTGLGLSSVYGIIAQCQGGVTVKSTPNVGTTFTIYLPRVKAPLTATRQIPTSEEQRGQETILVVDDEPVLARLAARILEAAGYRTLVAFCGADAKRDAEAHDGSIDLLLTDVVMPGMSGPALAAELVERTRGLKVLFTSGYSDSAILRDRASGAPGHLLSKPYGAAELRRRVRAVLDGAD